MGALYLYDEFRPAICWMALRASAVFVRPPVRAPRQRWALITHGTAGIAAIETTEDGGALPTPGRRNSSPAHFHAALGSTAPTGTEAS